MLNKETPLIFFGSSEFSVFVLNELKLHKLYPQLIITTPDKPKGRKLINTPSQVSIWATENNVECIKPNSLKNNLGIVEKLKKYENPIFLVASYGKMIPKEIFEIPDQGTLNIHPSFLPKYRGASPIQSQILNEEKDFGVTIMKIAEEMDAGPIVIQKAIKNENPYEIGRIELEEKLAVEGARLFCHILPEWQKRVIDPIPQNDSEATFCKKIEKEDGEIKIDFSDFTKNAKENILKIKAFEGWPNTYFFFQKDGKEIRVIIKSATLKDSKLEILKVIPEGKKEMDFKDFLRGV